LRNVNLQPHKMEAAPANSFASRIYDVYVILGAPDSPQIWDWQNWQKVANTLEPFVKLGRDKTAIRTTQFVKDSRKSVSFGPIGWNEKSHQKWTHNSPATIETSKDWSFLQMELWSPTWSICEREKCAPDVFFAFRNEMFWPRKTPLKFNQTIIVALSELLGNTTRDDARTRILQISSELNSPLVAYQNRTWGRVLNNSGMFDNSIQDLVTTGLFKVGDYQSRPVNLQTFAGEWTLLPLS